MKTWKNVFYDAINNEIVLMEAGAPKLYWDKPYIRRGRWLYLGVV